MKPSIAIAVFALAAIISVKARADEAWQQKCKSVEGLARSIMGARQNGVDISKMVDIASKSGDKGAGEMATKLVFLAYRQPHYQTEEMQQKTIDDFANDIYVACAQSALGK